MQTRWTGSTSRLSSRLDEEDVVTDRRLRSIHQAKAAAAAWHRNPRLIAGRAPGCLGVRSSSGKEPRPTAHQMVARKARRLDAAHTARRTAREEADETADSGDEDRNAEKGEIDSPRSQSLRPLAAVCDRRDLPSTTAGALPPILRTKCVVSGVT